jgi:hypothetical protein
MDVAALILSIISLIVSLTALIWLLAKHFSTHQIQMVPMDMHIGEAKNSKLTGLEDFELDDDMDKKG